MFENLSERFQGVLKKLRGHGRISEGNVEGALNEVRLALLEADVNYKVVKDFVAAGKEKALGPRCSPPLRPTSTSSTGSRIRREITWPGWSFPRRPTCSTSRSIW